MKSRHEIAAMMAEAAKLAEKVAREHSKPLHHHDTPEEPRQWYQKGQYE